MPLTFEIFPELGIVLTIVNGRVTDSDLWSHDRDLENTPGFKSAFHHILDATAITENYITEAGLIRLATHSPFSPDCRRAFVLADGASEEQAGIFTKAASASSDNMFVTHDRNKAYEWLLNQ
jgi:hypothetical protein